MALLAGSEIGSRLEKLEGWQQKDGEIEKLSKFEDFVEAMVFVQAVADLAEEANHHPDIAISWNKVTLTLSTHSQGGLTENDFDLAAKIDNLGELLFPD